MDKGTVSTDKYSKVESGYTGIHLGYDHSNTTNNGRVYNGVAISYTDADNSFGYGSGKDKAYEHLSNLDDKIYYYRTAIEKQTQSAG